MSGLEAGEQIAALDPKAVVVFVTGHPLDIFSGQRAFRWPALVLRKPFDLSELERVLQLTVH